ncbi:MAG: hypothetical protein M3466_12245 [Gemmatimonadota bacterium]|jgi:hypothetical protein|nr:hypothetical protein [Gemmatimonadota bacterium]
MGSLTTGFKVASRRIQDWVIGGAEPTGTDRRSFEGDMPSTHEEAANRLGRAIKR